MSSMTGKVLQLSIFGQSHSRGIGCVLDGLPAGIPIDLERLQKFMARRAPGTHTINTPRKEADTLEVLGGLSDGVTCGAPFAAIIYNTNTRSSDYQEIAQKPRPGHADFTAAIRYGNWNDSAGGGHFSGRLTAPLTAAGGLALQALTQMGIRVQAHITHIGNERDKASDQAIMSNEAPYTIPVDLLETIAQHEAELGIAMANEQAALRAREAILQAASEKDSVGGMIECIAWGMPAGVGDPIFDGIENRIARISFGIPAVRGIEFGYGMQASRLRGSEHNDPFGIQDKEVLPLTNFAGGILGGITTGAPIVWRLAIKPTPSIAQEQRTVDMATMSPAHLRIQGRHDPCIVPRAVPVVEAAGALALLDALLEDGCYKLPASRPYRAASEV
ncbi:chorismate synthase [Collinsella sp. AGMB00827]|uniref:Chorismate synthase n=1 Tax=Collinsella ureilytica TaxID=2869515 RepID=A0ABS7MNU9_9ACTN|nr:chorismate synthase [Collinsella urealyticum]MBY4798080.1 chorismate synthase [Collinsella urealyticum]